MTRRTLATTCRPAPTTGRLYLVLSWLVIAYYAIIVSRGISLADNELPYKLTSPFVPAVRTTRDVDKLLLKQFNKWSTTNVAKLRGVLTSTIQGRHKKSSIIGNYFELFACVCVQTVRCVTTVIKNILLQAGDIELNPGPSPPSTPNSVPPQSSTPPKSEAEIPFQEFQSLEINNAPLSPPTLPDPDLAGTSIAKLPLQGENPPCQATLPDETTPADRKALERPMSPAEATTPSSINPKPFPGGDNGVAQMGTSVASLTRPHEEAKHEPHKTEMVVPRSKSRDKDNHDSTELPSLKELKSRPTDSFVLVPKGQKRQSLPNPTLPQERRTATRLRQVFKKEWQCEVSELRDSVRVHDNGELSCASGVDQAKASHELLFEILTAANKLYRRGEKCPICPACLEKKAGQGKQSIDSHVIPKGILHNYWKIHKTHEASDYIIEFSRNERLAANSLTYQLLCQKCETHYSKTESLLIGLYVEIAAEPEKDCTIDHKVIKVIKNADAQSDKLHEAGAESDKPQEADVASDKVQDANAESYSTSWLTYILANILFRGILANLDLEKCQRFKEQIYHLWRFCSGKTQDIPDLKVFLLPNKPFNDGASKFMYPFEMLLRMPRCTELIEMPEGTFFYTKFDSFHVVLPLCEKSREYYGDTFNNGLKVDDRYIHLRWSVLPKAEIDKQADKSVKVYYSPSCPTLKDHFPETLMRWCAELYPEFISKIHNHPELESSFLAGVDRYSGADYVCFKTEGRLHQATVLKEKSLDEREYWTINCDDLNRTNFKECVSNASKYSPMRSQNASLIDQDKLDVWYAKAEGQDSRDQLQDELEKEKSLRQKSDENFHHLCQAQKEQFEIVKRMYQTCVRHNSPQDQSVIDDLKDLLSNFKMKFEYIMTVTEGTDVQHEHEELYKVCNKLLNMTPPSSPIVTSPNTNPYI